MGAHSLPHFAAALQERQFVHRALTASAAKSVNGARGRLSLDRNDWPNRPAPDKQSQ